MKNQSNSANSYWATLYILTPAIALYGGVDYLSSTLWVQLLLTLLLCGAGVLLGAFVYQKMQLKSTINKALGLATLLLVALLITYAIKVLNLSGLN